jgi:hypothetical protein
MRRSDLDYEFAWRVLGLYRARYPTQGSTPDAWDALGDRAYFDEPAPAASS